MAPTMSPSEAARDESRRMVAEACADLRNDELRVVLLVAERLGMGARQYGALDIAGDSRNWRREAAEELLDGCIYLAAQSLRASR